ncbi:DUF7282 domain-containing protein [Natrinema marinum]|uniref:DUF7282 domain-containing protein n=1 Tax=Natrinema marinum TaxID=2961598 RepID=UPI0020C8F8FA|nr:hypothetical protein [Natrinema marinum]
MNARKQVLVVITALMLVCSSGAMVTAASGSGAVDESAQISEDEYEQTNETVEQNVTDNETVTDDEAALENETADNGSQAAYVTFDDQTTEGETVVVANATLASGGFVTIHDSSLLVGNVIGSVIGTSEYLEAGTHENITITLDEPLEEDETLIAMPHRDTNQNETYDFVETEGQADGPYLTADGEPVTDQAVVTVEDAVAEEPADNVTDEEPVDNVTDEPVDEEPVDNVTDEPVDEEPVDNVTDEPVDNVTEEPTDNVTEEEPAEATVTFDNQTTEGETVVVANTTLPSAGFVTIHDSSLLEGNVIGSVIGVSDYLEAGTHENITITLDDPLEEDETLIAMPHQDTNDNETYDFVETEGEEDGPFLTAEGEPVIDDAFVTVEEPVDEEPVDNVTDEEPVDNVTDDEENVTDEEPVDNVTDDEENVTDEEPIEDNVTIDEPMDELPIDAGDRPIFVTVENTTIENLNVENASIYVFVVSPNISPDDLPDEMENITDEIPTEDNVTEDNVTEDNVTEEEPADNVTDEEPFDENVTEEPPSMEDNITEDNVTEDNVTDEEPVDNVTEDNVTDEEPADNVTEDNVTDEEPVDNVTEDNVTEDNVTEDNVTDEEPETADSFNVTNLEAPDNATIGENITVTATIENPTDQERTEAVQFRLDGDLITAQNLTLEAGASEDVEFDVSTEGLQPGDYIHMVLTDESGEVAMIELTESTDTGTDIGESNETETENETGDGLNESPAAIGALS